MKKNEIAVFWFRRDLRLQDNTALYEALNSGFEVLPLFIFDEEILNELPENDARVNFIYDTLYDIQTEVKKYNSSLLIKKGNALHAWQQILNEFNVKELYFNKDYEPYARKRDQIISELCAKNGVEVYSFKDQVIFEESEIVKIDGNPYTVYTPYKNKWLETYNEIKCESVTSEKLVHKLLKISFEFPSLQRLGFSKSSIKVKSINYSCVSCYEKTRDIPFIETSNISVFLRFGLLSIRKLVVDFFEMNSTFISELIWREFFMQILFHFPEVVHKNFKPKYNNVQWRNNEEEFKLWCEGKTGYPIVDAGMRQLNETGYMHNRVRMITASFLCKHLLIDWRWGEAYFAEKLLDYELASNSGNWQWVAGTGCDAAPYFRVFNPITQQQKFDPNFEYIKKWIPNFDFQANKAIVEHKFARERFLKAFVTS